jgi:hypothetical protein
MESVSIRKPAARWVAGQCAMRSARTPTPLSTRRNARRIVRLGMERVRAWRGRAGQALDLVESGVLVRSTANSSPRTAAGHKQDDQTAKTKPPAGSCSRILDQSLGSTRARSSRNRTLQQASTKAGRVEGWAGHSCHSRRIPLTSHRKPEPNVNTPRLHTR